jgi:membrane carboxypeptidase/penicillin-binding protein
MTPSTRFVDSPIVFEDPSKEDGIWKPKNFDENF